MKPETVVIVGGGYLQVPMVKQARALGLNTIVTDQDPACPARRVADLVLKIDTYDIQKHRKVFTSNYITKAYDIRGVATCGADVAPTVAAVAEELCLPGIPFDVASRTHNKAHVRAALATSQVNRSQPRHQSFYRRNQSIDDIIKDVHETFFHTGVKAVVVKPTSQRASRGVTIVAESGNLTGAIMECLKYGNELLVEAFVAGTEHSVELILQDGEPIFSNIVDRIFSYSGGIPLELGHVNQSRLYSNGINHKVIEIVKSAAHALGVFWGPFKADICMMPDGHVYILECTARLSGGFDCQATTPYSTGRNPIRTVLMQACDIPMEKDMPYLPTKDRYFSACAAAFPLPGRIVSLPKSADFCNGYIMEYHIFCKEGDILPQYRHNAQRPAFFISQGNSYGTAWQYAQQAAVAWERKVQTEPVHEESTENSER